MGEQLDWLARNVHVWPKGKNFAQVSRDVYFYEIKPASGESYSKQQWLDRRAELQGKPSWESAPEWAEWLAQDNSGSWWFFKHTPENLGTVWDCDCSAYHHSSWVDGEVLGDWRDTLEQRPAIVVADCVASNSGDGAVVGEQPLSRADALRWAVENVKTWPKAPTALPRPEVLVSPPWGWEWRQCSGHLYLACNGNPLISELEWSNAVEQSYEEFTSVEDAQQQPESADKEDPEDMFERLYWGFDHEKSKKLNSTRDIFKRKLREVWRKQAPSTHTIHHAAFLHHDCQLLLNEPELVVFRTADGELLHCKPKECLIDPDQYGLAARLLSDMSGYAVAPEHIRELAEQMNWSIAP